MICQWCSSLLGRAALKCDSLFTTEIQKSRPEKVFFKWRAGIELVFINLDENTFS